MKKHILLVDDDRDELNIFAEALNRTGIPYKITWAHDGEQALSQLQYLTPDFVFLDLNMPGLDGFDTLRRIVQQPRLSSLKTVMYSNGMTPEACAKAMLLGASYCIKKTDTIDELTGILNKILEETNQRAPAA